jgi:hypothetical protein
MKLYLVGSLRNPEVPSLAARLRAAGHVVFDDWMAAGPEADDKWMEYEKARGRNFAQALEGYAAKHVFEYDRSHLDESEGGILLLPAGRSGHLEAGYLIGQEKPLWILMPGEPERFDVMYRFSTGVFTDEADLLDALGHWVPTPPYDVFRSTYFRSTKWTMGHTSYTYSGPIPMPCGGDGSPCADPTL